MKPDEAEVLAHFLKAAFPNISADQETLYRRLLGEEDADLATKAVLKGIAEWRFPPSWAQVKEVIKREARAQQEPAQQASVRPTKMPPWVRRYVCARFLYSKFHKPKDTRVFREQYPDGIPPGYEPMPDDAWVEEANQVGDADLWKAIRGGT